MKKIFEKKSLVIGLIILAIIAMSFGIYSIIPKHNVFVRTGNMRYARSGHKSVLLKDGRVLIVGGTNETKRAEIYNPKTGKFSLTRDLLYVYDDNSTLTLLNDGRILITGGNTRFTAVEIFDPKTGIFKPIGNTHLVKYYHTANLLPDGKVLFVGSEFNPVNEKGYYPINMNFQRVEVYDPVLNNFTLEAKTNLSRFRYHTILLPNQKVLILPELFYTEKLTKGYKNEINLSPPAEIYDIKTNKFNLVSKFIQPKNKSAFDNITDYFLLGENKILLVSYGNHTGIALYDYKTNKIKYIYKFEGYGFYFPCNPVLMGDSIMFMGGNNGPEPFTQAIKTTEIVNYKTLERSKGPDMKVARYSMQSIIELKNGDILISGGWDNRRNSTNKAELYKK